MDQPLDVAGLASFLGVSTSWVRHECAARRIPFTKVANRIRFTQEHVLAILAAGEQRPATAPAAVIPIRTRRTA